ncbi:MAG: hypothetical protein JWQ97_918, partial [Phenylobacterium sp.]|nr:hypothetical protein [Phenylobacterium sp.]
MIPYARLTPGPGFRWTHALFYYAQRLVTLPAPRRAISRLLAAAVNWRQASVRAGSVDAYGERVLDDLRQDGVALLAPLASKRRIARISAYFMKAPVIGPDGDPTSLDDLPPGVPAAAYALATVLNCPDVMELVNSPAVMQIVAAYLGCKPTLSSLGVRWSFPTSGAGARFQTFHRDVDDWRFLKLFVYLTDVCEDSGPHCYVRTSHRSAFGWRSRDY